MREPPVSESKLLRAESLLLQLGDLLGIRLRLHSDVAGDRWVAECMAEFSKEHGRAHVRDMSKRQLSYDLIVNGFRVQCKTRKPKRGRSMSIEKWWGKARYSVNAFDFLALKYGEARYVIPYSALIRRDGTFKNDIKPDSFWKYRDQWTLQGVGDLAVVAASLPLFDCMQEGQNGR